MIFSVQIENQTYRIDLENPLDISIPLKFNGAQPSAYGVGKARSKPCEAGSLVGDTRRGGSCNFEQMTFIPHCNGTHTECAGHLTNERIFVHDCLRDSLVPATLVSVAPENASETNETYPINLSEHDQLITRRAIEKALGNLQAENLIVRTLPNDESKLTRIYADEIPPFFSTEAMRLISECGVKHLLTDVPSIDRIFDEGKLSNHRIFWNVEPDKFELNAESLLDHTVTEMIFVPDSIADGAYFLNLQIAAFAADASPSRPRLFRFSLS